MQSLRRLPPWVGAGRRRWPRPRQLHLRRPGRPEHDQLGVLPAVRRSRRSPVSTARAAGSPGPCTPWSPATRCGRSTTTSSSPSSCPLAAYTYVVWMTGRCSAGSCPTVRVPKTVGYALAPLRPRLLGPAQHPVRAVQLPELHRCRRLASSTRSRRVVSRRDAAWSGRRRCGRRRSASASAIIDGSTDALAELGRHAEGHGPARHLHAVGHDRVRSDERVGADDGLVQHDRAVADERPVLDRAALEVHHVADHALVADDRGEVGHAVDARCRPGSRCGRRCGSQPSSPRSTAPGQIDASAPMRHRTDDDGVGMDVRIGMDVGHLVAQRVDRHGPLRPRSGRSRPGRR